MPHQRLVSHTPPQGILQDAGELAVLTENAEPTRHRYAMVISFESEDQLRQALGHRRLDYRVGITAQERMHEEGPSNG
ncbi:hypothetical protein SAMN02745148_01551 [Modicisalibacter ilicicola DSM 19980]|uniref:Uncharacterized protein n=1 Tax=Modicisalibacter ilicicola DSM 19980 TaxID=1121942 RepID=A0A1M4Y248_9GAMM|nr:hypothetical protein [Halomonas ilicicola]SHE99643.1 hypothetical protein SAMN02745148_01551 [Halomonas ilicicola DSM 19980]